MKAIKAPVIWNPQQKAAAIAASIGRAQKAPASKSAPKRSSKKHDVAISSSSELTD